MPSVQIILQDILQSSLPHKHPFSEPRCYGSHTDRIPSKNRLHMYKVLASSETNGITDGEHRKGVPNVRFGVRTDQNEFNLGIQLWRTNPQEKQTNKTE